MEPKYDVVALGEVLMDLTESGVSEQGNVIYEANPGGAPCNVLSMLQKLGHKTAFIGKVGEDFFGRKLKSVLEEIGIDNTNLVVDEREKTTLAFVQNDESGDREFTFYRNPGADRMLQSQEVNVDLIRDSKLFHFGTLSMTHEEVRKATRWAVETAKESSVLISFDPNLRPALWDSMDEARKQVAYGLKNCDFLKISDNEIQWFSGQKDCHKGMQQIVRDYQIPCAVLSMGQGGSRVYYHRNSFVAEQEAFLHENSIDTTGAGDTFCGCCLHYILTYGLNYLEEENLRSMLRFANAAASLVTMKKGALRVMPGEEEILGYMNRVL